MNILCDSGMPECKLGLNDRVLLEAQGRTTKGKAIDRRYQISSVCLRLAIYASCFNDSTSVFLIMKLENLETLIYKLIGPGFFLYRYVRLARFENDRTISFILPDGSCDLMTYRLSTQVCFILHFVYLVVASFLEIAHIIKVTIFFASGKAFNLG